MRRKQGPITVLLAEDDPDDRLLAKQAWEESRLASDLRFVEDGEDLMDYLYRRGKYNDSVDAPWPDPILLDLNMPRKDGREALKEIKKDLDLRQIPLVVLTVSKNEEDVCRSYKLGANSYVTKPVTFQSLVDLVQTLGKYWFETVELPSRGL